MGIARRYKWRHKMVTTLIRHEPRRQTPRKGAKRGPPYNGQLSTSVSQSGIASFAARHQDMDLGKAARTMQRRLSDRHIDISVMVLRKSAITSIRRLDILLIDGR